MEVHQYQHKPFIVSAVEITEEHIEEVAKWCGGEVISTSSVSTSESTEIWIRKEGQSYQVGFIGSMVVMNPDKTFSVIPRKIFDEQFVPTNGGMDADDDA